MFRDASISCDELKKATDAAFKVWEDRHPIIYFTPAASVDEAELVIGAQSKTVVDATAKNPSLRNDPDIRRAHQRDILTGVGLDDGELGQEGTVAFAQSLPENHQNGKLPTGTRGAALMGTHGEPFEQHEGARAIVGAARVRLEGRRAKATILQAHRAAFVQHRGQRCFVR